MKSDKGIAMLSLVIYVASFLVITTLVGTISTYFYNNINLINSTVGGSSEYTKLNLYMLNLTKKADLEDVKVLNIDPYVGTSKENTDVYGSIVFIYNDSITEEQIILTRQGNNLYYSRRNKLTTDTEWKVKDKTLLCSDVTNFSTNVNIDNGKEVVMVNVKLSGSSFATKYVVGRVD